MPDSHTLVPDLGMDDFMFGVSVACIRESVDSLCRDDADMPMPPYIRKACNRPNAAFVSLFRYLPVIYGCFST